MAGTEFMDPFSNAYKKGTDYDTLVVEDSLRPGAGILVDTERLIRGTPIEKAYPYYIVLPEYGLRVYGKSSTDVIARLIKLDPKELQKRAKVSRKLPKLIGAQTATFRKNAPSAAPVKTKKVKQRNSANVIKQKQTQRAANKIADRKTSAAGLFGSDDFENENMRPATAKLSAQRAAANASTAKARELVSAAAGRKNVAARAAANASTAKARELVSAAAGRKNVAALAAKQARMAKANAFARERTKGISNNNVNRTVGSMFNDNAAPPAAAPKNPMSAIAAAAAAKAKAKGLGGTAAAPKPPMSAVAAAAATKTKNSAAARTTALDAERALRAKRAAAEDEELKVIRELSRLGARTKDSGYTFKLDPAKDTPQAQERLRVLIEELDAAKAAKAAVTAPPPTRISTAMNGFENMDGGSRKIRKPKRGARTFRKK